MAITDKLSWLRTLLADVPAPRLEQAAASGAETDFIVKNPPMLSSPAPVVTLNGAGQTEATHYTIPVERDRVHFLVAPPEDAAVTILYYRKSYDDVDLAHYIAQAEKKHVEDTQIVYRAAIYAIDALLIGAATALNFGDGAGQTFDMVSVWERLQTLRALWVQALEAEDADGVIEIVDVTFDSLDPGFPGSFDPNDLDSHPFRY